MKTLTKPQIDILDITKKDDVYTVKYWDENCEGENNVQMQISEDALLTHIESTGLNNFGDEFWASDAWTYLDANTNEVVKDYITVNS